MKKKKRKVGRLALDYLLTDEKHLGTSPISSFNQLCDHSLVYAQNFLIYKMRHLGNIIFGFLSALIVYDLKKNRVVFKVHCRNQGHRKLRIKTNLLGDE